MSMRFSRVADRRPLYAELDPGWDARIAMHVEADGLWLSLEPQPLGRSDRRMAAEDAGKVIERVGKVAAASESPDRATESVLLSMVRQQTVAGRDGKGSPGNPRPAHQNGGCRSR